MKKIVLYSDGTGNSSSNPQKSNVWRAYQALDRSDGSGQVAFYDNGVGTSSFSPTAVLGLVFGWGLARNVRQIYGFLCRTYDPGDEIYCFGFSRGAFTIRVVAAFIASQGIIDRDQAADQRDLERLISAAYNRYRQVSFTPSVMSSFLRPARDLIKSGWNWLCRRDGYEPEWNIRHKDGPDDSPLIKFVGVWDTVDAYGLPVDEFTRAWDRVVWPLTFKDRNLSPRVARACHALALDEQRESFEPMLWNENGGKDTRLTQVWFSGVHSNVGGGYPDDALALKALNWILDESEDNDGLTYLAHERQRLADQAEGQGPIYDNRAGIGNLYRYAPRDIDRLCNDTKRGLAGWFWARIGRPEVNKNKVLVKDPKVHHSVIDRLREGGDAYAPISLPENYVVVDASRSVVPKPETSAQAKDRKTRQSYVWNKVWRRKLLYFATLVAILCFVLYPYSPYGQDSEGLEKKVSALESFLGTFSFVIRAIPDLIGKVPGLGFAESWATRYAASPFVFSLGLLAIGILLLWTMKVNSALKAEMRANWHHLTGSGSEPSPTVGQLRKSLAAFLGGAAYRKGIERPIRLGLETIAVAFFLVMVVAACSRLTLAIVDGVGGVCGAAPQARAIVLGTSFFFDPIEPCIATGLKLEKERIYRIDFVVSKNWDDGSRNTDDHIDEGVVTDVNGWRSAPWYMYIFTPFRRHLFAGWYQPIARIDDKLYDRYPLANGEAEPKSEFVKQYKISMNLEPRRNGELHIYLNDAVFFLPGLVKMFYDNNDGCAQVTVTEVTGKPIDPALEAVPPMMPCPDAV